MRIRHRPVSWVWRLDAPAASGPSFLIGTIHQIPWSQWHQRPLAESVLADCDRFYGETEVNLLGADIHQDSFLLPEGKTLPDILGKHHYERSARIFLKCTGTPLQVFDSYLPLVPTQFFLERQFQGQELAHPDEHLWNCAESQGKSLHFLESFAEQQEILTRIPLEFQVRQFLTLCRQPAASRSKHRQLLRRYQEGDLLTLSRETRGQAGAIRKLMIRHRHPRMMDKILDGLGLGTSCICVGAGHLGGKAGLLSLLKHQGVSIRPVS